MYINPDYTDSDYQREYQTYFCSTDPLKQLSLNFVIRFREKLPETEELEAQFDEEDFGDDDMDYTAWGYALTGRYEPMEHEGHEVIKWERAYEEARLIDAGNTLDEILENIQGL